ncbi:MAG: hypothetical protein K2O01_05700 [Bacteroidales bacterium]|nr:hypothetical protein [Bacteroidales bacterium]
MRRLTRTIGVLAAIFGLLTAVSCRLSDTDKRATVEVRLNEGAGRMLTLYELRANTGTVVVETIRLDKNGEGMFRFTGDSLSLFVLQTEPTAGTRAADGSDSRRRSRRDIRGDEPQSRREATDGEHTCKPSADAADGLENRLVIFPTAGGTLRLDADYADLTGSAHLTDGQGQSSDSLQILPFQQAQQAAERLNREAADYWMSVRYDADARHIYDSLVQRLDHCYRTQKTESVRLAAQYPHTLIPVYLAQLQLGNRPLFDPRDTADLRTLAEWATAMRQALPANPHVVRFSDNIERLEQLQRLQALQREQTRRAQDGKSGRRPSDQA